MAEGVDYAGDHPSAAGLYAAGKRFAVRYGGPGGSWKHLTAAEAAALTGAGLALVANAEGTADGMLGGWDVGVSWARSADTAFRTLGMPADRPIYLSVDFDCGPDKQWEACAQALRGAASVLGPTRVGVYGSYDVMQWAKRDAVARWFWQTYAWSGGRWAGHNHLEQYRNGVPLAGGTVDLCRSKVADYGQWGVDDMDLTAANLKDIGQACWAFVPADHAGKTAHAIVLNDMTAALAALRAQVAALAGRDLVDEPAIVAGVLAGLTPEAIAAAIPTTLAAQVVDLLSARLAA